MKFGCSCCCSFDLNSPLGRAGRTSEDDDYYSACEEEDDAETAASS